MITPMVVWIVLGATAGWSEGPAFDSLRRAAAAPAATLSLERQSVQIAAIFTGGPLPVAALSSGEARAGAVLAAAAPAATPAPSVPPRSPGVVLREVRAAGTVAAAAGPGWLGYAVAAATAAPVVAVAALLFFGGLAAYLADRRLRGREDF